MASCASGSSTRFCASPSVMMSSGTGVGSVQTPLSWPVGFVTEPVALMQFVAPTAAPLQYCASMLAHLLPPTFLKNELTYVWSDLLEWSVPLESLIVNPWAHSGPQ